MIAGRPLAWFPLAWFGLEDVLAPSLAPSLAIRAMLESALSSAAPSVATAWENCYFLEDLNVLHQVSTLLFASPESRLFGRGWREQGILHVSVRCPAGTGSAAISAHIALLMEGFKRGTRLTSGELALIIRRTPEITPARMEEGYLQVSFKAVFFAEVFA